MIHIRRLNEMKVNEVYTSPAENKLQTYYADGVNGLHKNTDDSFWELMGDTWNDVLNYLKNEGYTHVYDFSDGDTEIYEKDGVYYMMDIKQEEEGSWGSWIVDLTPVMSYVRQLLSGRTIESRASRRGYRAINESQKALEDEYRCDGYVDAELNPNEKYSLRDILTAQTISGSVDEPHTKYELTTEGLIAVYETLPNHLDTALFKKCYYETFREMRSLSGYDCVWFLKLNLVDWILEKITPERFIEIVESGRFLRNTNKDVFYPLENGEHFDNSQYKQWAEEIRNFVDFSK